MEASQAMGAQQQQGSVADENMSEAGRMAGVANAPMQPGAFQQQGFSDGGIVGYAEGGSVIDKLIENMLRSESRKDAFHGATVGNLKKVNRFFSLPTDTAATSAISSVFPLGM